MKIEFSKPLTVSEGVSVSSAEITGIQINTTSVQVEASAPLGSCLLNFSTEEQPDFSEDETKLLQQAAMIIAEKAKAKFEASFP